MGFYLDCIRGTILDLQGFGWYLGNYPVGNLTRIHARILTQVSQDLLIMFS